MLPETAPGESKMMERIAETSPRFKALIAGAFICSPY
jgi:hypothetical protein